jgi:hypothetical protein
MFLKVIKSLIKDFMDRISTMMIQLTKGNVN